MKAAEGAKNVLPYYKYISWMYPFLRAVFPKFVSTLAEVGQAMINVTLNGYNKQVLEVNDIVAVAKLKTFS